MTHKELVKKAREAAGFAVCDVSGFPVGAALLCEDGRVFTGCNVESPSIIHVVCAERVALLKALSEGARSFVALALYTPEAPGAGPCGVCRQMLSEFAPDLKIIRKKGDKLMVTPLSKLLPEGFAFDAARK